MKKKHAVAFALLSAILGFYGTAAIASADPYVPGADMQQQPDPGSMAATPAQPNGPGMAATPAMPGNPRAAEEVTRHRPDMDRPDGDGIGAGEDRPTFSGVERPDVQRPEIQRPEIQRPEIQMPEVSRPNM